MYLIANFVQNFIFMWDKIINALSTYGLTARDARVGAVGADQIRSLYNEGKNEEAAKLAKDLYSANIAGINLATGYMFKPLIGATISTASTLAEAPLNNGETIGKDLAINTGLETLGYGLSKLPIKFKWTSLSKSDPLYSNGQWNGTALNEGIVNGKRMAESYLNSQTYKDAVAHDVELAKRAFGIDIKPVTDGRYVQIPVAIEAEPKLGSNTLGRMISDPMSNNPADDLIQWNPNSHKTVSDLAGTIFHESLHHGRYKTINPEGNTVITQAFTPEKIDPTLKFYRWKLKHLLKPEVDVPEHLKDHYKYLMSVEVPHNEGATNVLELGLLGNFRKAQGYPGGVKLQQMLDEVRNSNIDHRYTIDLLNMNKPKRVWEALTGQYHNGGKLTDADYKKLIGDYLKWNVSSADELAHLEKKLKEA